MSTNVTTPIAITTANFRAEVLESSEPVIVDFWAPWCGPCRAIGPVLEEQLKRHGGKVKVAKINVDEQGALAGQFQIRGIPTLLVFNKGKEVEKIVGFHGRQSLVDLFEELAQLEASSPIAFAVDRG